MATKKVDKVDPMLVSREEIIEADGLSIMYGISLFQMSDGTVTGKITSGLVENPNYGQLYRLLADKLANLQAGITAQAVLDFMSADRQRAAAAAVSVQSSGIVRP